MNNFKPSNNSLDIPWIESPFFNQLLEESDLTDKQKEDCKFYNENGYLVIDLGLTDGINGFIQILHKMSLFIDNNNFSFLFIFFKSVIPSSI